MRNVRNFDLSFEAEPKVAEGSALILFLKSIISFIYHRWIELCAFYVTILITKDVLSYLMTLHQFVQSIVIPALLSRMRNPSRPPEIIIIGDPPRRLGSSRSIAGGMLRTEV